MEQLTAERGAPAAKGSRADGSKDTIPAARFLLKQLSAWGVMRVYGVIGDSVLYVLGEIAKQNDIRFVACRHEEAAALMASAEAKLTGRVTVCMATSGPGMANLLNGLADAALDRAPVLAVTGQVDRKKIGTYAKQYIDQQKLISPITEQSTLVTDASALPELLLRALMTSSAQGQVSHLSVPMDIWTVEVDGQTTPYPAHLHQSVVTPEKQVQEAVRLLHSSRKPVLYIGRGTAAVSSDVRRLAERLGAAVVTTLPARPLFPNDHPLYCGGLGHAGSEASTVLLAESDLILVLGATWWPQKFVPKATSVIQIDRTPANIGRAGPLALGLVGDLARLVPELLDGLESTPGGSEPDRSEWRRRVSSVRADWGSRIRAEAGQEGTPVAPQRLMKAVSDTAPDDAVLVVDTGDHTLWFDRVFQTKPKQDVLISGHWRTLGFALPAAVAAKLAQPGRPVLAIAGDGGAVQTLLELQTAVQYKAAIVLIVVNNGCYAMERNRMINAGLATLGSELANPDFVKIAEACGALGLRAETPQELEAALERALGSSGPVLIDVLTQATIVPHTSI